MKLIKHRHEATLGINMTPMIDIVFLLIIFFMTVSQITQVLDHPVNLPDVKKGGQAVETVSITLNLDGDGTIFIAGQEYTIDDAISATMKEFDRVDGNASRIKILVRGDRDCPGKHINELNHRLTELGITQIRLSVMGEN